MSKAIKYDPKNPVTVPITLIGWTVGGTISDATTYLFYRDDQGKKGMISGKQFRATDFVHSVPIMDTKTYLALPEIDVREKHIQFLNNTLTEFPDNIIEVLKNCDQDIMLDAVDGVTVWEPLEFTYTVAQYRKMGGI